MPTGFAHVRLNVRLVIRLMALITAAVGIWIIFVSVESFVKTVVNWEGLQHLGFAIILTMFLAYGTYSLIVSYANLRQKYLKWLSHLCAISAVNLCMLAADLVMSVISEKFQREIFGATWLLFPIFGFVIYRVGYGHLVKHTFPESPEARTRQPVPRWIVMLFALFLYSGLVNLAMKYDESDITKDHGLGWTLLVLFAPIFIAVTVYKIGIRLLCRKIPEPNAEYKI